MQPRVIVLAGLLVAAGLLATWAIAGRHLPLALRYYTKQQVLVVIDDPTADAFGDAPTTRPPAVSVPGVGDVLIADAPDLPATRKALRPMFVPGLVEFGAAAAAVVAISLALAWLAARRRRRAGLT